MRAERIAIAPGGHARVRSLPVTVPAMIQIANTLLNTSAICSCVTARTRLTETEASIQAAMARTRQMLRRAAHPYWTCNLRHRLLNKQPCQEKNAHTPHGKGAQHLQLLSTVHRFQSAF